MRLVERNDLLNFERKLNEFTLTRVNSLDSWVLSPLAKKISLTSKLVNILVKTLFFLSKEGYLISLLQKVLTFLQ